MLRLLLVAIVGAAVAAAALTAWGYKHFHDPGPLEQETILIVPKGSGLGLIGSLLAKNGVIKDRWLFLAGVRLLDQGQNLKAGEYAFPARISPRGAMELLVSGKTVIHRITIVEGLTVVEALAEIRAAEALDGDITDPPPEGMMMPETYYFSRGDARQPLIDRMRRAMRETLDAAWQARDPSVPLKGPEEALILASIVEKETGVPEERTRVAAVFGNRLKKGMPLQADPTVVYALSSGGGLDRPLTRADLQVDSPYNTYLNRGLPPGPIAIPSRASIEAALNPAKTKDLYFVADGSGGHAFAETLDQHNRNVAKWRRVRNRASQ